MTQESVYKDKMERHILQQEILLEEYTRIEKLGAKELNLDIKP